MDVLNTCMETLVESYHNELLPVAGELTARLVSNSSVSRLNIHRD